MQIQYFNNLRATACFLVLLTHSAMPATDNSYGVYMVLFSVIASPSSELFVTISSCLLAPTKQDMFSFYKKRFGKLILPFFFWSVVVLAISFLKQEINISQVIYKFLLFPIKPTHGVYWFVYTICGLYLIIPIISPWLLNAKKREIQFLLLLWSTTLIFPYLNILFGKEIYVIKGDYYFILSYLGGFVGFLLLGVYLRKYPIVFKSKVMSFFIISCILIIAILPLLIGYLYNRDFLTVVENNLSLTSALFVVAIFCFYQNFKLPKILEHIFNDIAKYSYGIYLIHILVIRDGVWLILKGNRLPHPLIETPLIAIVSLILCYIIVLLISKLPKSRYVIGV
ncbi:acyltransferase [Saccharicrinis aurantiacus]|uniref:acyltransferase n=1 Tax=Saccharicrinis aurantiacus TaxID=1849719 RepID=UPI0024938D78|nr:acyltransferase [Saccharicrinis aurantiacus]